MEYFSSGDEANPNSGTLRVRLQPLNTLTEIKENKEQEEHTEPNLVCASIHP